MLFNFGSEGREKEMHSRSLAHPLTPSSGVLLPGYRRIKRTGASFTPTINLTEIIHFERSILFSAFVFKLKKIKIVSRFFVQNISGNKTEKKT